jgi:hypothetical protein
LTLRLMWMPPSPPAGFLSSSPPADDISATASSRKMNLQRRRKLAGFPGDRSQLGWGLSRLSCAGGGEADPAELIGRLPRAGFDNGASRPSASDPATLRLRGAVGRRFGLRIRLLVGRAVRESHAETNRYRMWVPPPPAPCVFWALLIRFAAVSPPPAALCETETMSACVLQPCMVRILRSNSNFGFLS